MNRLMAGAVAGALAAAGVVALAVPGLAQEQPEYETFQGEASIDPGEPTPGQQVTASDDSCFEGTTDIYWLLHPADSFEVESEGRVPLNADGSWEVTFTAPGEPGDHLFFGLCMPPDATLPTTEDIEIITAHLAENPPAELLDEWGVDSLLFYNMVVPVASEETPTTTVPATGPTTTVPATPGANGPTGTPSARPATPVPGRPDFTG
jgi:hypothetical protein